MKTNVKSTSLKTYGALSASGYLLVLNPNPCNESEKLALVGLEDLKTVLHFAKAMQ